MSTETQIKSVIEEYLNLESSLDDFARARAESVNTYNHLLTIHDAKHTSYDIHSAAPVIHAYDEIKTMENKTIEARYRLKVLGDTIKGYIHALNGRPLAARFMFDGLNHRAGVHTFYLDNDELKTSHAPLP